VISVSGALAIGLPPNVLAQRYQNAVLRQALLALELASSLCQTHGPSIELGLSLAAS
jgi:hypothetical protein